MYIWNKIRFEFSYYEVHTMDNFMGHYADCIKGISDVTTEDGMIHGTEKLKTACQCVRNFFDRVLGAGAAKKMFGNRYDYLECQKALLKMVNTVKAQIEEQNEVARSISLAFAESKDEEEE